MFDLAIEIANMKKSECTPQAIQNLFARYGIYRSQKGQEVGYESSWFDDNIFIFFNKEDTLYKALAANKAIPGQEDGCAYYAPGDKHYAEVLWAKVSDVQEKIRALFDKFIHGDPATEELKEICDNYKMRICFYAVTENPWRPNLGMIYDDSSVERYIISHEIIAIFYRGEGELFQRIRRCPECGKYFYAKDVRKTYCSEKCRNTMNNKNRA